MGSVSRFLYKYMPLRVDFFNEPMIRATPAKSLNDPFEGLFNDRQLQDVNRNNDEYFESLGHNIYRLDELELNEVSGIIEDDLDDLGILSFTEDYTNPLMWAHYSDEHKGMVVEFDCTKAFFSDSLLENDGRDSRFGKVYLGDTYEFPEKVMYRREMPDFSRAEVTNPKHKDDNHWNEFTRTILFTKANEWIYEKEHRSIVRLSDADVIICDKDDSLAKICARDPLIKVDELSSGKMKITFPRAYEMLEEMGDESLKQEIYIHCSISRLSAIHLFRINPQAISGVYFGCKSKPDAAMKALCANPDMKELKNINKMQVNSYLYQLDPKKYPPQTWSN